MMWLASQSSPPHPGIVKDLMLSIRNQFSLRTFPYHSSPPPPEGNSVSLDILLGCIYCVHFHRKGHSHKEVRIMRGKEVRNGTLAFFSFVCLDVFSRRAARSMRHGKQEGEANMEMQKTKEIWDLQNKLYLIILPDAGSINRTSRPSSPLGKRGNQSN